MSKADLIRNARVLVEEAFAKDPLFMEQCVVRITGGPAFAWDYLSTSQLHALGRAGMIVRLS